MGLNAVVYCDDVENGRLRIPHPLPHLLVIGEAGCPTISSDDLQDLFLHDQWEVKRPCSHEHFWLVEQWLGNARLISRISDSIAEMSKDPSVEYRVLWSKVVYSAVHSGDYLKVEEVAELKNEVIRLKNVKQVIEEDQSYLSSFLSKLENLIEASLRVKKPISF
jgi:hypothetical protein